MPMQEFIFSLGSFHLRKKKIKINIKTKENMQQNTSGCLYTGLLSKT